MDKIKVSSEKVIKIASKNLRNSKSSKKTQTLSGSILSLAGNKKKLKLKKR